MPFCPKCGKEIKELMNYCPDCSFPMENLFKEVENYQQPTRASSIAVAKGIHKVKQGTPGVTYRFGIRHVWDKDQLVWRINDERIPFARGYFATSHTTYIDPKDHSGLKYKPIRVWHIDWPADNK
jgi:hypothetical protein